MLRVLRGDSSRLLFAASKGVSQYALQLQSLLCVFCVLCGQILLYLRELRVLRGELLLINDR